MNKRKNQKPQRHGSPRSKHSNSKKRFTTENFNAIEKSYSTKINSTIENYLSEELKKYENIDIVYDN